MRPKVVTIDGPAGAGKTTVSRALAEKLGFTLLDSGALYRAVALTALERSVAPDDDDGLEGIAESLDIRFDLRGGTQRVWIGGRDVTTAIREPHISERASKVSARPRVRAALLALQRGMGEGGGLVAEGRDMGTVVFPDAPLKVFLDASADERARRRGKELRQAGHDKAHEEVRREQQLRDRRDSERQVAPLRAAADAVVVDTTNMPLDQVVSTIQQLVSERIGQE